MKILIEAARDPARGRRLDRKIGFGAWGLFFTWTGVVLLGHMGWGAALVGVGAIIFGAQAARRYLDLDVEQFWLVTGFLFAAGGIWKQVDASVDVVPILFIAAGVALLVAAMDDGREGRSGDLPGSEVPSTPPV
jgi:hypothetical protein